MKRRDGMAIATDERGRALRDENIHGLCDVDGRLLAVGDAIMDVIGEDKGQKSVIVGFRGDYAYLDSGCRLHKGYCFGVRVAG